MVKRVGEKKVHETEGRYVPIKLLGELGASEEGLHALISQVVEHANVTPMGAAAHIAHAVHKELSGGARMQVHHLVKSAQHHYGVPAHKRGGLAMGGMALGGLELGGEYDGGFSFGDFLSGAKKLATSAKAMAQKVAPIAQQAYSYLPQAASVLGSLGLNKLANVATQAHSTVGDLADKYGSTAQAILGSGGARAQHRRGYARR